MSKFSTLNFLINSYNAGKKEVEETVSSFDNCDMEMDQFGYEPSQNCIDAILSFASQFEVLKSGNVGNIELNLN
jgi:hypothetical protein